MTSVELPYGRDRLIVDLPRGCHPTVITKQRMPIATDPAAAVQIALDEPVGTDRLEDLGAFSRPEPARSSKTTIPG